MFSSGPKTVLSPDYLKLVTLVPNDAPHPLYDDSPQNSELREQFLLDYLVQDPVSAQDPRLTQPQGLTVSNMGGRDLTFKMDSEGKYYCVLKYTRRCMNK